MLPNIHSLQNEPTLPEHSRRRRDWDPAFSVRALHKYRENIQRNAEVLLEQIDKLAAWTGRCQGVYDVVRLRCDG